MKDISVRSACSQNRTRRLLAFLVCVALGGWSAWALPDGFTALDYIESTGAQRIDTNYTVVEDVTTAEFDFGHPVYVNDTTFFGLNAWNGNCFLFIMQSNYFRFYGTNGYATGPAASFVSTEDYHMSINDQNQFSLRCANARTYAVANNRKLDKASVKTLSIFGVNGQNSKYLGKFRFYRLKLFERDELKRDYVPCLNASAKPGIYDNVTGVFHANVLGGADFNYQVSKVWNAGEAKKATWGAAHDAENFNLARNWMVQDVNGRSVNASSAPPDTVDVVELAADADWRGFNPSSLIAYQKIDLKGHKLQLAFTADLAAFGEITDTVGGGELELTVPDGVTQNNTSLKISGLVKVVKVGAGTLQMSRQWQSFLGGLVVREGTVKFGAQSIYCPLGGQGNVLTVESNGTLDFNGQGNDNDYLYILSGGRLVNNGANIGVGTSCIKRLVLTADSTIGGTGQFGIVGWGYTPTHLSLNGHTLNIEMASAGAIFHITYCTGDTGTIHLKKGTFYSYGANSYCNRLDGVDFVGDEGTTFRQAPNNSQNGHIYLKSVTSAGAVGKENWIYTDHYLFECDNPQTVDAALGEKTAGLSKVIKRGKGQLSIGWDHPCYGGGLDVQAGSVKAIGKHCFGKNGMITLAPGTWLDINGQKGGYQAPATIIGDGNGNGAIQDTSTTATDYGYGYPIVDLTLAGDASLGCPSSMAFIKNSYEAIAWNLGEYTLTKKGAGELATASTTLNGTGEFIVQGGSIATVATMTFNVPVTFQADTRLDLNVKNSSKGAAFVFNKDLTLENGAALSGTSAGATLTLGGKFVSRADHIPVSKLILKEGAKMVLPLGATGFTVSGGMEVQGAAELDVSNLFAYGEPQGSELVVLQTGSGFSLNGGPRLTVTGVGSNWKVAAMNGHNVRLIKANATETLPACVETATVSVNANTLYDFPASIGASLEPGVYDLARWTTAATGYGMPTLRIEGCPYETELVCGVYGVKLLVKSPEQSAAKPIRIWLAGDNRMNANMGFRIQLVQKLALAGWNVKTVGARSSNQADPSGATVREAWRRHNGIDGMGLKTNKSYAGFLEGLETYALTAEEPEFTVLYFSTWSYWDTARGYLDGEQLFGFWKDAVDRILARFPNTTVIAVTMPTDTLDLNQTDYATRIASRTGLNDGIRAIMAKSEAQGGFPAGRVVLCDIDRNITPTKGTNWNDNWQYTVVGNEQIAEKLKAAFLSAADFNGKLGEAKLCRVRNSLNPVEKELTLLFNKPLSGIPATVALAETAYPDVVVPLSGFALSEDGRMLTCKHDAHLTPGISYTLTVNGVSDQAHLVSAQAQRFEFVPRALGLENNVPEAYTQGFVRLATLDMPLNYHYVQDTGKTPYTNERSLMPASGIAKAGYYIEAIEAVSGELTTMWIDYDAISENYLDIMLPVTEALRKQKPVTKLHVWSNSRAVKTVEADNDAVNGFIEFNPINYSATAANPAGSTAGWLQADNSKNHIYDWNDTMSTGATSGHGTFQFFRMFASGENGFLPAEALFTFNRWGSDHTDSEGFGFGTFADYKVFNTSNWTLDRTFCYGAPGSEMGAISSPAYSLRRIEFYAKLSVADSRDLAVDGDWTGATDLALATPGNWEKNGTPLTTLTGKTVRVPSGTASVNFTYPTSDPTALSSTTLMGDGCIVLNTVGALYLRTLDMGATGRLVFDPTKTTLRFATAPRFAAGAKISLAPRFAQTTSGRFLLCTFDRGQVVGPANLTDIFDASSAHASEARVWVETLADGSGRLWLDLDPAAGYKPVRVMCVGDSITHGSDSSYGNWRIPLMKKLCAAGFDPTATGFRCDQSLDEAGATMPEKWIWHSGVGGRRLISGNGGGVQDALETEIDQAGDVDVLLLKIGTNDINSDGVTAETLFTAWTNTVMRMLNQSKCKIVAGAIVNINDATKNAKVTAFNAMIKAAIEGGQMFEPNRVFFADLYTACPRFDANGNFIPGSFQNATDLHPDWYGEDLVAEEYARVIQLALAGGMPQHAAEPTTSGILNNVPEAYRAGFKLARVYNALQLVDLTNAATEIPYEDFSANEGATQNLVRVGYYIELKRKNTAITDYHGRVRWLWVDVSAFGERDIETCGLPLRKWAQQPVTALHVISNMPGIDAVAADDDTQTGFVEFWPYNYNNGASGVAGAPANKYKYDWNDVRDTSGTYGSMQVHRILPAGSRQPAQVLFAFNAWRAATGDRCLGLGTFAYHDSSFDWTHVYDANSKTLSSAAYEVGRIEIWTIGMNDLPQTTEVWRPANATVTNVAESVAAWMTVGDTASTTRHGFPMGAIMQFDSQDAGADICNVPAGLAARVVSVTGTKSYVFAGPGQIVADHVTFAPAAGKKVTVKGAGIASDDIVIQRGTVRIEEGIGMSPFGAGTTGKVTIKNGGQLEFYYPSAYSYNNAIFDSVLYDKEVHIEGDGPDGKGAILGNGTGANGNWYSTFGRVILDANASIGGEKRLDFRAAWANRLYTGRPTLSGPGKTFTSRNMAPESYDLGFDFNNSDIEVGKIVVAEGANIGFEGTCNVVATDGIELKNGSRLELWNATVNGTGTIYIRAGITAKINARSSTCYLRLPVVVEEGGTLILGGTATMRFEAGIENRGGTIRQESSGSHYFLSDVMDENTAWRGEFTGSGQLVFGDPTTGKVPGFPLLDLTGAGTGNIWFRLSEDQTLDGGTYKVNAPNASVFVDALNTPVTIEAVPRLTVKDADWNFSSLKMGSSANPGSLVIDGGEVTCKTLTAIGGTDWRSGRIELKNGGKLAVTAANHGVESCAAQIASTTSTGNALENVIEVGSGSEFAVPNGYFFNGWSGRYARTEVNEGATATLYGINGRRRYNGVNGTTKHDSIFRMNGGTLNLGPGGFLHGYTAYAGSAQSNEVLKDHYAESGSLFRLNAGTLVATADTVSDKNQNSEGVDIVFGESGLRAGAFTINPNGYNLNLRSGIKGWSDVTVKGAGSFVTDPHVKGFAQGKWRVEEGVNAQLDGAAGFMGGLDLAPNATARVNAISTGLVEFLCGSFTWVGLTNATYMTRYTFYADDLYYAQRKTHANGPNYQAFAYRGEFYVPADKAGTWWFFGQWDDVVVVQVDGQVVVNGGGTASRGSIALAEGWHPFVVYVNDGYGGKGPNAIGVGFRVGSDGGTTAGNYTEFNTTTLAMRPAHQVNWYQKNMAANFFAETANLADIFAFNIQDYDWMLPTNSVKMCNCTETAFKDNNFKQRRNYVKGTFWVDPAEAGTWAFLCGFDDYSGLKIDGRIITGTQSWTQQVGGSWEATPGLHEFEMVFGDTSGGYGLGIYSGLAGKAMIAVSVNGAEYVPFDEDYFGIAEVKYAGLAGTSTLAKGSCLTNAGAAPYPIIGTVFGGGTLDGAFRFEGGWLGVTGVGSNYESVKFAHAASDTFKGLAGVVCNFTGLPGRNSYCLGDAMGLTDSEARALPVVVGVSNGGNYNYSLHASSMHCEVIGGKLYLVDPISMNSIIFFR